MCSSDLFPSHDRLQLKSLNKLVELYHQTMILKYLPMNNLLWLQLHHKELLLMNVSVINFPVLSCFISSFILISHSRFFCFLHSIQFPQPTGTRLTRSSVISGGLFLFFLFGKYFGFFIIFGYKHISFFLFIIHLFGCLLPTLFVSTIRGFVLSALQPFRTSPRMFSSLV